MVGVQDEAGVLGQVAGHLVVLGDEEEVNQDVHNKRRQHMSTVVVSNNDSQIHFLEHRIELLFSEDEIAATKSDRRRIHRTNQGRGQFLPDQLLVELLFHLVTFL